MWGRLKVTTASFSQRILLPTQIESDSKPAVFLQFMDPNSAVKDALQIVPTKAHIDLNVVTELLPKNEAGEPVEPLGWDLSWQLICAEL
jgi:hypothetical protein